MNIALTTLSAEQLSCISAGDSLSIAGHAIADGALPPPHVVTRSLHQLAAGCSPDWALPFNIVDTSSHLIVGGCGFKGFPSSGSVEIGYRIAPACQGRGHATAAVRHLLAIAALSGLVREVFALISHDNFASAAVVTKAGFTKGRTVNDHDGESVARWHWLCAE